ncbi:DegT/DnrJ/EryC1/StrS aminotransferase family protein [Blastococcus sp. Marseille-P5729]|uniref:DegT/DnrJ/EryC1/StrS family aminotransferase n=1 Tax=Blastococcus sp. Marseille-P5729 TaxID=2086582 RepID=UPI000D10B05E|nr:DegT/DnrJ/EryC1/StrS family aminotransferase [Blastococcus sp. Marseille-P5729]
MIPAAAPIIGQEEQDAVLRVLQSGMIAQGPEVSAFETEFADLVAGAECVAVNSGTSALHMGLIAAGVQAGDEVIVPSFTFAATGNSVALAGATPVFADIEPDYFCLDPGAVEAAITERTVGIMPVHLYGHPANMTELRRIADARGLAIYEDAAQAHGAELDGKRVGSFGTFGAFSLYPTKNMTSGEGGMVTTGDPQLARMVRLLRNQGMEKRYENEVVGFNTRMTDVHAAIGRAQLRKLADWTAKRQANAKFLDENLRGVVVPPVADNATHVYHQYTIRLVGGQRDEFVRQLADKGVGSGVYYPIPTHQLPSFEIDVDLPETARAAAEVVSLPVHPSLTQSDLEKIVESVNAVATAGA